MLNKFGPAASIQNNQTTIFGDHSIRNVLYYYNYNYLVSLDKNGKMQYYGLITELLVFIPALYPYRM